MKKDLRDEVIQLAKLSKLRFSEEELLNFIPEFEKIISFSDKINELDLEAIEPLVYIHREEENKTRPDEITSSMTREEALKNAPAKDSDYFRVPKVFDK